MKQKSINYRLVYVGFSFVHHGIHSGYDYIKNVVPYSKYIDCQKSIDYLNLIPYKKNIISKIYLVLFGDRPWWVELKCIYYALFYRNLIFHFIYSEKIFRYTGFFKGRTNKIVCTLHLPADSYPAHSRFVKSARYIDKIIVLSSEMLIPLQKLFRNSELFYIPHGVDTTYFKPLSEKREKKVLMVGDWLRNFEFADSVFKRLFSLDSYVKVSVVSNRANHRLFTQNERLNLLSDIDDDHLLYLYQSSAILFLPLNRFTANNALLEGAACGCKIIIASEQPTGSCYIGKKYLDVVPFDVQIAANKILDRLHDQNDAGDNRIVDYVRTNYDWKSIGKQTEAAILNSII